MRRLSNRFLRKAQQKAYSESVLRRTWLSCGAPAFLNLGKEMERKI